MIEGSVYLWITSERIVNLLGCNYGAHWKSSSCESFSNAHHVRHYSCKFRGEHSSGTAESYRDFIQDEEYIILITYFSQPRCIFRGIDPHTRRALT